MELWKTHPRFTDYEVSDTGGVRRLTRSKGTLPGRLKLAALSTTGYLTVNIEAKPRKVHVLVLETFVGARPPRHDGCHLDGDRLNNHVGNLAWASRAENMAHARMHGTDPRCERHGGAKLTAQQVDLMRQKRKAGALHRELAAEFGVSKAHVSYIMNHGWRA